LACWFTLTLSRSSSEVNVISQSSTSQDERRSLFGISQIPLRYLVADRFEAGSKLVADLQRAEIWPIISLASSELARTSRSATGPRPASNLSATSFQPSSRFELSRHRDTSNMLEPGRIPVRSQIPLRYLVADRFEAGRGPVADLLDRASSLLAS